MARRRFGVIGIGVAMMLSTVVSVAASPAGAVSARSMSESAPPCVAAFTQIKGNQADVYCGPATATVKYAGKSYSFKKGFCTSSKSAGTKLDLELGTIIPAVKNNGGLPYFSLDVVKNLSGAPLHIVYGGKVLLGAGGALVTLTDKSLVAGTFKSQPGGPSVSGTWNCHGAIYPTL